jgi:predicted RNA binding protein with dsRBD fold (UPF0201 family)
MENKVEKALDNFLNLPETEEEKKFNKKVKKQKTELLNSRTGLIERVDKQYVTEDGRMLLREVY